jgi:PilZ domain
MTHLKLVENPSNPIEKRKIPRFPFSFLTFKNFGKHSNRVFEVREISLTGAQLLLKDGKIDLDPDQEIEGELHWKGKTLKVVAMVVWVRDRRLGLAFKNLANISNFLKVENVLDAMQVLHNNSLEIEYPSNLKFWLHSDGPVEILIWDHQDGEWSEFQIIYFKNFIEWIDGSGVKTGVVLTRRNLETSVFDEEEFLFQIDKAPDNSKIKEIFVLLDKIPNDFLPPNVINFLKLKLSV